ncbi:hypothetical protein Hanom_Chr12g01114331 [Helianthus anomalus]
MATKTKPQGPRFKKFEIWTKMAKVPKPQGPKWQFTHLRMQRIIILCCLVNRIDEGIKPAMGGGGGGLRRQVGGDGGGGGW